MKWFRDRFEAASTLIVFALIYVYLARTFSPSLMVSETITAGGDMASHYYPALFLHEHLLPNFDVIGWMPGWYAGMPLFQFYFPLPFIWIAVLGWIIPLEVSFKLVSVLGVFLLPACMYLCLRFLGCRFPVPLFGASFSLPFLFLENHSMWGGNIPSTLAGEFSYSISLSLTVLFLGSLYYGLKNNRLVLFNIFLLAAIALTHVYTVLYIVSTSLIFLYILGGVGLREKLYYFARVYIPAFLLVGFWIIPLIAFLPYTTSYNLFWVIAEEISPPMIWPFMALSAAGLFMASRNRLQRAGVVLLAVLVVAVGYDITGLDFPKHVDNTVLVGPIADFLFDDPFHGRRLLIMAAIPLALQGIFGSRRDADRYIYFSIVASFFYFTLASPLGVVDIRFLPFIYLSMFLLAAIYLGRFTGNFKAQWILPLLIVFLTLFWVNDHRAFSKAFIGKQESLVHTPSGLTQEILDGEYEGYIPDWIKWNYAGFSAKTLWVPFKQVNDLVSGDFSSPRVVYEHNTQHNAIGTLRAFESLPLFSGRSTLEGLYMQSTPTAPFVFYIQSEVSQQQSCPFAMNWKCSRFNLDEGVKHLRLFNVEYYIARSDKAKNQARIHEGLEHVETIGPFEVYRVGGYEYGYVSVPENKPVLVESEDWRRTAYDWFKDVDLLDTPLVFTSNAGAGDIKNFGPARTDIEAIPQVPVGKDCSVKSVLGRDEINFSTSCVGVPHLVKVSYHPGWHAEGAGKVFKASPSFMIVVPQQEDVRLYFSDTWIDVFGKFLTVVGLAVVGYLILDLMKNDARFLKR